jgi:50S ribosome-binding GTPase
MTPGGVAGAVAIIQLQGDALHALATCGLSPLQVGMVSLRDLLGVDQALIARVSRSCLQLMPHGGTAVVRRILSELTARGIPEATACSAVEAYPEAADEFEARMLAVLGTAASPLAVDLLLDQPRRWRARTDPSEAGEVPPPYAAMLARLLVPPLVVVVGPANIGKSTLLNHLAGRQVAIVADQPGTTRDHVGVLLDLAGLCVRYVDTPGLRAQPDAIELEAITTARRLAEAADLIVLVADASTTFADFRAATPTLKVGLRSDLGRTPGADHCVSAHTGEGLEILVDLIRSTLLPPAALADPRPWRFWRP